MLRARPNTLQYETLEHEINCLIGRLGAGIVRGVAYDTAWIARLAPRYPGRRFDYALEWLRRNQNEDGTWGGALEQYHDRFVSTLAAIVALREVGTDHRDERRARRGEQALWKIVGRLGRDDSDTIGFPIIAAALGHEAQELGLDVPLPPLRFGGAYRKKVQALLDSEYRDWTHNTVTFSLEALRHAVKNSDRVLEENGSVTSSPSATAAYLMTCNGSAPEAALRYLQSIQQEDGSIPAVAPIDLFEIAWSINYLRMVGAIQPDTPGVPPLLDYLWGAWSPEYGAGYSTFHGVTDSDGTSSCFTVLRWGGYPVSADVFEYFEGDDYFYCFHGETNPSLSANVRLLAALRTCPEHPRHPAWMGKVVNALHRFDENGSYWWDKWHVSPYYVSGIALDALQGVDDDLVYSRLKWILRTQNDDGGWGYLGLSTPEETAYCLEPLVRWSTVTDLVDRAVLDAAADYLWKHADDERAIPLWIGKSLYYPPSPVQAAILGALFRYTTVMG
ncbi:MAG: hypothetical protein GXY36_00665 [Chloroflexi bacterium]|jgi:hypothetical protein|nr:hypothetical protein [Chloroflexota bacterium]